MKHLFNLLSLLAFIAGIIAPAPAQQRELYPYVRTSLKEIQFLPSGQVIERTLTPSHQRPSTTAPAHVAFISDGGESSRGFSLTRTTANSGSTANITVNVADDLTMSYDGNLVNNVY